MSKKQSDIPRGVQAKMSEAEAIIGGKRPSRVRIPDPRAAVRAGHLDKTLDNFDAEQRQKMIGLFETYHENMVVLLEKRIARLERPLWRKVWDRVTRRAA